jgi:L-methionine (R)-S-oxide reductase
MKAARRARPVERSDILHELDQALKSSPSGSRMKKVVRLLRKSSDHYSWVGVYLVKGKNLVLKAYAGDEETEHVTIPIGQGICGSAAKTGETITVSDVNKDPRYLMCFPSTRSEIVVPIIGKNGVLGEIDIDSDKLAAFTTYDKEILEKAAGRLAVHLEQPLAGDKRSA